MLAIGELSQQPSPSGREQRQQVHPDTDETGNATGNHELGPQSGPIKVQIVPTPQQEADAARKERQEEEGATSEWRLVHWTIWLVGATITLVFVVAIQAALFIIQLRMLRHEPVISHRGWVFTQPWPPEIQFRATGEIIIKSMEIRLYGESPAVINFLYVDFAHEEPRGRAFYPNEPIPQTYGLAEGNRWFYRKEFRTTVERPYVFGYVEYTDQFKRARKSRFCYRLDRQSKPPIVPAGSPDWSSFD